MLSDSVQRRTTRTGKEASFKDNTDLRKKKEKKEKKNGDRLCHFISLPHSFRTGETDSVFQSSQNFSGEFACLRNIETRIIKTPIIVRRSRAKEIPTKRTTFTNFSSTLREEHWKTLHANERKRSFNARSRRYLSLIPFSMQRLAEKAP